MPRKPSRKTLKNKADQLFSLFIRKQNYCEMCKRSGNEVQLQCAHIFSRRYLVTRWLPINALCLCAGCHHRTHAQPIVFAEFVKEYLGEDIYDELKRVAKTSVKKVDFEKIVKDLKEGNPPYQHIDK